MKQWLKQNRGLRAGLMGLLLLPAVARAQQAPQPDTTSIALPPLVGDTAQVQLQMRPDSLAAEPVEPASIDSARLVWLRTPPTVRELVCDRVGCFETDVPHQFNNSVMAYVTLFTARNRSYMQRVLERENFYFPIFEKYLAQYNLPTDLKYLAVVESALIPTAKSPVGATGLWQFMGPTAGDLQLKRDEWVDERMHPEKATEAACKHLRYLYGVFHDWELVLAAYNWGAGNIQRVMRRTGKRNFWDLYPHMPAETRNYVPTFTAIMYSMKYAQLHGLHSDKLAYQYAEPMDTLGLRGQAFDLRRLSRACGYADSLYLLRFNPELRRAALPAGYRPYVVRYPASARPHLGDVDRATLRDFCQPSASLPQPLVPRLARLEGVEPFPTRPMLAATNGPRDDADEAVAPRFRRVPHTVRRGETLAAVAERFEVSQAQLRRWNGLSKGKALKPGRKLVVFVPLPAASQPVAETSAELAATAPTPRPTAQDEVAQARRELAAANARETARLTALAEQERYQEALLARLRQRQAAALKKAAIQEKSIAQTTRFRAIADAPKPAAKAVLADSADNETTAVRNTVVIAKAEKNTDSEKSEPKKATASTKNESQRLGATRPETYTVHKGDNLTRLARENDLTVAQLIAWNQLKSENVVPGQRLRLQAPANVDVSLAAVEKPVAKPNITTSNAGLKPTHTVQPGDTLYNISRRFGVTVEELRQLNHLTSDEVKLGQKLLVGQG